MHILDLSISNSIMTSALQADSRWLWNREWCQVNGGTVGYQNFNTYRHRMPKM